MGLFWKIILIIAVIYFIGKIRRYLAIRRIRRRLSRGQDTGLPGFNPPVTKTLKGLDASKFQPPGHDELKALGRTFGRGWLRMGWWDTERIPSESSPRVGLIDKAMVGMGLIKESELKEAHRIGEIVDKATGDERLALEAAEGEIFQDFEERQALKLKKKEEAEQKRKQRAEEIALRRQTDIIYLGRGVSKDLNDRRANVEKLEGMGLPILSTPGDLASALGISIPKLRWLAFHSEASPISHYTRFTVSKKSGGKRDLFAPHGEIAQTQLWIKENILDKIPTHEAAHGFVKQRSVITNATHHVGKEIVMNMDIKDFFPSITYPRIKGLFKMMGYSRSVATILALLVSECPRATVKFDDNIYHVATGSRALPQGACASPAISNLCSWKLDKRLQGLSAKLGWTYTRYADDMTFSKGTGAKDQVGYLMARIRHILKEEGFELNKGKTRVLQRNTAQTVTGITVNDRTNVARKDIRRIRAILHNGKNTGLQSQNRDNHPDFRAYLSGWIAYISMVAPEKGAALKKELATIP